MPEVSEPFGRHRWDPLVDAEQPLRVKDVAAAAGEPDEPSPGSAETATQTT